MLILHVRFTLKVPPLLDVCEDGRRSVAQPFVRADGVAVAGAEPEHELGASRCHPFFLPLGHAVFHE